MAKITKNTFVGGELGSKLENRFDFVQYQNSAKWIENWSLSKEGNLDYRNGTFYVDTLDLNGSYTSSELPVRLFQWIRSETQIYLLVFKYDVTLKAIKIHIYKDFTEIDSVDTPFDLDELKNIQTDNQGNFLYIVTGNRHYYTLSVASDVFTLTNVDSHSNGATPPWQEENLTTTTLTASATTGNITLTASADLFDETTSSHISYDIGKYIKIRNAGAGTSGYVKITGITSATVATATVYETLTTTGPTDNWAYSVVPNTVLFFQGRLYYASGNKFVASRTQDDDGLTRFNDFTLGSDETNAINLTNVIFKTDILWLKATNRNLLAGTPTGTFEIRTTDGGYISPTNLPEVFPISSEGSTNIVPIQEDNNIFYVSIIGVLSDKGSRLSSITYDFLSEGYKTVNTNVYNDEINEEGIIQYAFVRGYNDVLYCLKNNGELSALIYNPEQQINGWYRLSINDWERQRGAQSDNLIESVSTLRQTDGSEVLIMSVKRGEVRTIEYLSQPIRDVDPVEFYTGNEENDTMAFNYYLYQSQLNRNFLDSAEIFSGLQNTGLTLSTKEEGEAVFTSASYTFVAGDVGRLIKEDFSFDLACGVAEILEYIDANNVRVNIVTAFESTSLASFVISTKNITLDERFWNKTIGTIVDGGKGQTYTVPSDGELELQYQGSFIIVGFIYEAIGQTLNLNTMFQDGNTAGAFKDVSKVDISFANTVGCQIGTSLYKLEELVTGPSQVLGKPPRVFTGLKTFILRGSPQKTKHLYFFKNDYCGCSIQLVNINVDYRE